MNTRFLGSLILLTVLIAGCSPRINVFKDLDQKKFIEIKTPFEEKNYKSTPEEFFQIVNTKSETINMAKQRNLLSAKSLLSNKINTYIQSSADQILKFSSDKEIEVFNSKSKSFSSNLIDKVKLLDSKIYKTKDNKYEYWAVYSVKVNDFSDLNKSQTVISDIERNKNLKKLIDKSFSLEATTRTEPNNYLTVSDELIEDNLREKIELESKSYLGVPYVWGGNTPNEGFDCSGFVRWVYKKSIDKILARTTKEHYLKYRDIIFKNVKNSKKGDLIYFKTIPNRNISHVGIYLGENKFIHAPNKNEFVKIEYLSGYWEKSYVGYASTMDFLK